MGNTIQELRKNKRDEMAKLTNKTKHTKKSPITYSMMTFSLS